MCSAPYELLSLPRSQQHAWTLKFLHRDCKLLAEAGWPAHSLLHLAPFILLVIEQSRLPLCYLTGGHYRDRSLGFFHCIVPVSEI